MVTVHRLGNGDQVGKLGNKMFIIAAALSLAKRNNDIVFLPHFVDEKYFPKLKMIDNLSWYIFKIYQDTTFEYKEIPYLGDMSLDPTTNGCFQSEKYFIDCREHILDMFTPSDEIQKTVDGVWNSLKIDTDTVSIHVRRGDYCNLEQYHPTVTEQYLKTAMDKFTNCKFLCFSDDINWCINTLGHEYNGCQIVYPNQNKMVDLFLMTKCNHNIIANSSFSFWGAWLNPNENKTVCAPARWFGPAYDKFNTKDLIPEGWIKI